MVDSAPALRLTRKGVGPSMLSNVPLYKLGQVLQVCKVDETIT